MVETGRRRRWSEEEKARIVLESMSEPRLVAAKARRYGLSRSLLVTWRRAFAANRTKSEAGLVRVVVAADGPVASAADSSVPQSERCALLLLEERHGCSPARIAVPSGPP
ncbi:transposase [Bradyrhizobium sp. 138]|uniref:transposase n=1 Tax=Bradyrhizobium sp. 138 TaxID=2782615 RepID=UPI00320869A2